MTSTLTRVVLSGLACVLVAGLSACRDTSPAGLRQERKALAAKNYREGKDIHLAVVWGKEHSEFLYGATLAAEEIDAEGGVTGHRIQLDFTDETPFIQSEHSALAYAQGRYRNALGEAGTDMARAVTVNPAVTAVIGHMNSEATLSAMLHYQDSGVLLLSGAATDSRIRWSSNNLYIQLRPQDEELVKKMTETMRERKWSSVYLVYAETRHNEQVVELLKTQCAQAGIKLSASFALMPEASKDDGGTSRVQSALADLSAGDVDGIILLAPPKLGAQVIRQSRALGVLKPFIGTGELDSPEFINLVGETGIDTLITSLYRNHNYQVRQFAERFSKRFPGVEANEAAAMGYDSVRLYVEAVAAANTTDPLQVAQALHYKLPIWYGLMGEYSFKESKSTSLQYSIRKLVGEKGKPLKFVSVEDPV